MQLRLLTIALLVATVAWPTPASAQRGILIGRGEAISRLGTIKDRDTAAAAGERLKASEGFVEAAERARHGGVLLASVGFKYQQALLGMPLWTWDGQYCVFLGRRYVEISKTEAANFLGVAEAELRPPFAYRVPVGLVGYPLCIIIGVPVLVLLAKRADARRRRSEEAYQESFRASGGDPGERVGSALLRDAVSPPDDRKGQ